MSTGQRTVMLCGLGVKAGMACLQVKLRDAISERFEKCYSGYISAIFTDLFSGPGRALHSGVCPRVTVTIERNNR